MKRTVALLLCVLISGTFAAMTQKEIESAYSSSFQYETNQKYDKAISALSKVYKEYPAAYTVNYRLGWLYYLSANYANALQNLNAALLVYPYSVEVLNTINLINVARSEWEKVEVQSNAVFKIDFYNYYANYWYSVALIRQQKYDQAAKTADKMLAVFPTNVVFLNILAESKYLKGEKDEAVKIFESVIVLDKENETAKYYLGR